MNLFLKKISMIFWWSVLFFIGSILISAENLDNSYVNYQNSTYGIKISYHKDWIIQERGGMITFTSPYPGGEEKKKGIISLSVSDLPKKPMNLDEYINLYINIIKNSSPNIHFLTKTKVKLFNKEAYKITFFNTQDQTKLKCIQVVAFEKDQVSYIQLTSLEETSNRYRNTFDTMIESMEFIPKN